MNSISKIDQAAQPAWVWNEAGPVAVGSERHKNLFCRMLLETFDPYKPEVLDWPVLEGDALRRVTSLPFWSIAVETEDRASAHIGAMAKTVADPLVREALELMAFEESRHRRVLNALLDRYQIEIPVQPPYVPPPRTEWNFMSTGYGECLDSFFAFGLFELGRQSGYFPIELVETFEPVIREESRHIVFFVNWAAYTQANLSLPGKAGFATKRLLHLAINGMSRMGLAAGDEEDFATAGRDAVGVDISPRGFMDLCLSENERRMSHLDPRLLRPTLMPRLAKLARRFVPA